MKVTISHGQQDSKTLKFTNLSACENASNFQFVKLKCFTVFDLQIFVVQRNIDCLIYMVIILLLPVTDFQCGDCMVYGRADVKRLG